MIRNCCKILLLLGLVGTALTPIFGAEPPSQFIAVGQTKLYLGMTKESVLTAIGEQYSLKRLDLRSTPAHPIEIWTYSQAGSLTALGSIQFDVNNKLSKVGKDWTSRTKSYAGDDVAQIIYDIASRFEAEGNTGCALSTESSPPSESGFRSTHITCGQRDIEIMVTWNRTGRYVQINEVLGYE